MRTREAKLLAFEIEEIENAALNPEEDEQVEKRYRRLVNAKRMKETVYMVHGLTGYENEGSAGLTVGHALREIKTLRDFDEDIAPLIGQLTDIDDLLNDFNRSMAQYEDSLEFDEEEFVELEDRLNTLNHLKDKYGDTIASVLKAGEEKQEELDKLNNYEAYMSGLREKIILSRPA